MGRQTCIAVSGLRAGLRFCQELQRRVAACRLEDFASIRAVAESYLNSSYARFLARNRAWYEAHPEAPKVLCFILAGYTGADQHVVVWESSGHRLPLAEVPAEPVLTVPRVLGLEARLARLQAQDPPLAEVALFCLGALQRLAEREETVGRPFQVAVLSEPGCWILGQS